jgi:hypothetical protein
VAGFIEGGDPEQNSLASGLITIDRTAPTITVELILEPDSGSGTSGDPTLDRTPTIQGTVTGEYSKVTLELTDINNNTILPIDITPDVHGDWSYTFPSLSNEFYSYQLTVEDIAGNKATTETHYLRIDTDAPRLSAESDTGNSDLDSVTYDTTPTFEGIGVEGEAVTLIIKDSLGQTVGDSLTTTVDEFGTWSIEVDTALAAGEYTYAVTVDTTPYPDGTIVIDTTPPLIDIAAQAYIDSFAAVTSDDNTPAFAGNIGADNSENSGDLVNISFVGDDTVYSGVIDDTGDWAVDAEISGSPVAGDAFTYEVSISDVAGNVFNAT